MKKRKDIITIGFALFAMFFGAGNLLLPPFIGIQVGQYYGLAIFAFALTGILLPFLGVLSIISSGDNIQDLGQRVHKSIPPVLGTVIMLSIGPLIAIPRTAATTYEVGILPNAPDFSPWIASILFFVITFALSISSSKVVDIIGNFLTPVLLLVLFVLIVMGLVNPVENVASPLDSSQSFTLGFIEGYQTLDVLASLIFAGIVISAAKRKGYISTQAKTSVVIYSGVLAALCLLFIYGGLVYLGSSSGINDMDIKRSSLLLAISDNLLAQYGTLAIAICITFACLTTAIALTSAFGSFFNKLSGGKLSYKLLVSVCCIASCVFSIAGVDDIITYAYPFLAFVYPITITLVLYIVIFGRLIIAKSPYMGAILASTLISIIGLIETLGWFSPTVLAYINLIPFYSYEMGWVIPSMIGFMIGLLWNTKERQGPESGSIIE